MLDATRVAVTRGSGVLLHVRQRMPGYATMHRRYGADLYQYIYLSPNGYDVADRSGV